MEFRELLEKRRAYRALEKYNPTEEVINLLATAASKAPSCFNKQPWNFVFVKNQKILSELGETLAKGNEWAQKSSMTIAVFTKIDDDCRIKGRNYYLFDTGLAVSNILLAATDIKLVAHPIAGFDEEKAKKILNIPEDFKLITLIITGKHDSDYRDLEKHQLESELKRPERKKIDSFCFIDHYST